MDPKRFKILEKRLKFYEKDTKKITILNENFFDFVNNKKINNIELAVIDPSCSGSGMLHNIKNYTNEKDEQDLTNFDNFKKFC